MQACDRTELFLGGGEASERLGCASREDVTSIGETATSPGALDQPLAGGGLEQSQVLTRARLADADRGRRGGDASLPVDLDQEPHPGRVPELAQRAVRRHLHYR